MGPPRRPPTGFDEKQVLIASRRRCCLCVYLNGRDEPRRGQIAHLNRDRTDSSFENLVWLCLEHHDEYDGRTSQSKGFTVEEVRHYRDRLYAEIEPPEPPPAIDNRLERKWNYPLWQVANQPELFAYTVPGGMDGVCLIERINIPDGRIVIVCIQVAGSPGRSITNSVEHICLQVCQRFEIPPDRLVWLEYYDDPRIGKWMAVTFANRPPKSRCFDSPDWQAITPKMWRDLKLRPKKRLTREGLSYISPVKKLFPWPTEAILE